MNMVKRKRTVLALLLALCMIVMLLPATVFAEGENEAAEATNNPSGEEVIAGRNYEWWSRRSDCRLCNHGYG